MKKQLLLFLLLLCTVKLFGAPVELLSPDKRIKISVNIKDKIGYAVTFNGDPFLANSYLQLNLDQAELGANAKLIKKTFSMVNTSSSPVIPLKNSTVIDQYNLLKLDFKGNFSVEFRAYNDGIAYRFITNIKDSITVNSEDVHISFNDDVKTAYLETGGFKTSYEILYRQDELGQVNKDKMSVLPILFNTGKYKALLSEADLYDYPCLFVKAVDHKTVDAIFPKVPLVFGDDGDRSKKILLGKDHFPGAFWSLPIKIPSWQLTKWCIN
ncbi:glycoside hydrolase family 97 N-terminal domain-containing protein [Pedobacter miscanthi]|uniref:glycoside hydrolase family 97 N-terminal domain-containing protein n=1 Tax=Pedobacter miscanthi TaxID=2259170 RepID=UPI002931857B|nr:glycoside hydrolase family 97 N-terminal domain-containing protein [Pedobacter miscanthi]